MKESTGDLKNVVNDLRLSSAGLEDGITDLKDVTEGTTQSINNLTSLFRRNASDTAVSAKKSEKNSAAAA